MVLEPFIFLDQTALSEVENNVHRYIIIHSNIDSNLRGKKPGVHNMRPEFFAVN